ncbi:hypothetical protein [Metabacillus sp. B2-18]|uniref:hypothetical protein n=1 Tax=Metabacillus sp. B2-18 TaxID=2897333 RepID=UPI001E5D6569|nr:hypothetical protein [Metabacillus sp. B2-18]UGB32764.1 hypothetical protein LPC09_10185 [Metabacillus sp. B2-18]
MLSHRNPAQAINQHEEYRNHLENKVGEVLELINRYREIRYLAWLFSTREPPEEILLAIGNKQP